MQSASVLWHWQHVQTETYLQKLFYRAQPGNYTRLQMLGHGATKVVVLWERSQRRPLQGRLVPWWGAGALVSLWAASTWGGRVLLALLGSFCPQQLWGRNHAIGEVNGSVQHLAACPAPRRSWRSRRGRAQSPAAVGVGFPWGTSDFPTAPSGRAADPANTRLWQAGRYRPASPFLQLARPQLGSP